MNPLILQAQLVNDYLAHKQHLLPATHLTDLVQVTRGVVALHATFAAGPYLSLWARVPGFQREWLDDALYERRTLARLLCMRTTLHVVPAGDLPFFFQAYAPHTMRTGLRDGESLLVQAGVCQEEGAGALLSELHQRVLDLLARQGPSTGQEISQAVPELQARVRYSIGKSYEGELSLGSRLVPGMCTLGLLIRARPQGTWRSNLYAYAALAGWLPEVDLQSASPQEAQAWLVQHYLATFGPATFDDVQWWTGFSRREVQASLEALKPALQEVTVEGWGDGHLMLAGDAQRMRGFTPPDGPYVFMLPGLDPYIMGYRGRRRFLAPEHRGKVFDRAGNAMPTLWANGRVVGAWGQRKDGSVAYSLFETVSEREQALLEACCGQLEGFLGGEFLPPRTRTPFTRTLE